MASIYTDEAREARYAKLRPVKKGCDIVLGMLMILALWHLVDAITAAGSFFLSGLMSFSLALLFLAVLNAASGFFCIYAIYKKNVRITAVILLCHVIPLIVDRLLALLIMAVTLIVDIVWWKLEQQEGFPHFQITQMEYKERTEAYVRHMENRALEAGTRVAAEDDPGSDMHDLLDAGDKQALPAELRAYHERYLQAQAYETARAQHDGMMDSLEDIDMTPSAGTPQTPPVQPEHSDDSFTDLFTPM